MHWIESMATSGGETGESNRITLLRDADGDGVPETRSVFLEHLNSPFGVALVGNDLYVANTDAIVRYPYQTGDTKITAAGKTLTPLPGGPIDHHWTKSLVASRTAELLCRRRLEQQHHRERHAGRKESRRDLGGRPRYRPVAHLCQRPAQSQRSQFRAPEAERSGRW